MATKRLPLFEYLEAKGWTETLKKPWGSCCSLLFECNPTCTSTHADVFAVVPKTTFTSEFNFQALVLNRHAQTQFVLRMSGGGGGDGGTLSVPPRRHGSRIEQYS